MKFHEISYLYIGIWIFVIFIYLLGASMDKLSNYQSDGIYVQLGFADKFFIYQKAFNKGILLRTFLVELFSIVYFLLGIILIWVSMYRTQDFALQCIRIYFTSVILIMVSLYVFKKRL